MSTVYLCNCKVGSSYHRTQGVAVWWSQIQKLALNQKSNDQLYWSPRIFSIWLDYVFRDANHQHISEFWHITYQGFWPEWCISSMIYSGDTPFWLETLNIDLASFPAGRHFVWVFSSLLRLFIACSLQSLWFPCQGAIWWQEYNELVIGHLQAPLPVSCSLQSVFRVPFCGLWTRMVYLKHVIYYSQGIPIWSETLNFWQEKNQT